MNTVRAFQWMIKNDIQNSPKATFVTGTVGNDQYSQFLKEKANQAGVVHNFIPTKEPNMPTGTCAVILTKGGRHRSLVSNLAAGKFFDHTKLEKAKMEKAEYFYSAGFFLTTKGGPEALKILGQHAIQNNKTFMINLSAPFIPKFFKKELSVILPYTDIVLCNKEEALAWARNFGFGKLAEQENMKKIAVEMSNYRKYSHQQRPRLIVITNGKKSVTMAQNQSTKIFKVPKIKKENFVDTNGAGDAFVAGFIAGLVYNKPIDECFVLGNRMATAVISMPGCTFPGENEFYLS